MGVSRRGREAYPSLVGASSSVGYSHNKEMPYVPEGLCRFGLISLLPLLRI